MGESNCWQLEIAASAWEAMDKVQSGVMLDLILLDMPQEDTDGLHFLRWLRRLRPALPIILIGYPGDASKRQESIRLGARDHLVRPLDDRQLEMAIQRNLSTACEDIEMEITSDDVESLNNDSYFIGISPVMRNLRAQAALLAEASVPVLILGEVGSGKETTARLIHGLSVRSGLEFAKVNCAALPADLLERELFGYERVSATAPPRTKFGKLELCAKGTIFLDEITEMPLRLQSNLLQVLQNQRFIRPGTSTFIEVDVRILAASPINIERAISENRLREDLYRHLSAYTIHVPSLRDRKEEIPFLSRHFMHRIAKHYGLSPREFSPDIVEVWKTYHWPGNLQELEDCVKRYLMVGEKGLAFEKNLAEPKNGARQAALAQPRIVNEQTRSFGQSQANISGSNSLRFLIQSVKSEAEKNAIAAALEKTGWNRKAAARLLNVSYRTVLYKIEHYRMSSSDSYPSLKTHGTNSEQTGFRE
jgi:DNA-binding NtrC family response regulator